MIFGPRQAVQDVLSTGVSLNVGGENIVPVTEARNLGLVFDSSLRFKTHITNCIRHGYFNLKLIYNKRHFMNRELKSVVCNALVLSKLNFCDNVYGPCIGYNDARKIQVLQNACLRLIFGIRRRQRISHKLIDNHWLNMANRRRLHAACLFHKLLLHKCPPYLLNKITFRSDVHNVNVRFGGTVSIPKHRTELYKRSFSYQFAKIYNTIPNYLKLMNLVNFKKYYWKLLFEEQCLVG